MGLQRATAIFLYLTPEEVYQMAPPPLMAEMAKGIGCWFILRHYLCGKYCAFCEGKKQSVGWIELYEPASLLLIQLNYGLYRHGMPCLHVESRE
jgi:hypothetical protein